MFEVLNASPKFMRQWRRNIWLDFVERKPGSGVQFFRAIEDGSARLMILENFQYAQRSPAFLPFLSGSFLSGPA